MIRLAALVLALTQVRAAPPEAAAQAAPAKRLNILFISVCSLRRDHLGLYGHPTETAPNLRRLSKTALVFTNAYASKTWSAPRRFLADIKPEEFAARGYRTIVLPEARGIEAREIEEERLKGKSLRLERLLHDAKDRLRYPLSTDILSRGHDAGMKEIEKALKQSGAAPFFLAVHLKYMHRPYYPPDLREPAADFPGSARALLSDYLSGKVTGVHKLPVYAILLDRDDLLLPMADPAVFSGNPLGLINQREILDRWRRGRGFADDLALIKAAYDWKLRNFDESLRGVLSLYGDERLRENTVLILVGDHGEAFMEHGALMHGETVYDEELAVPLLVSFPGGGGQRVVREQFGLHSLVGIVRGIMAGTIASVSDGEAYVRENVHDDVIFSTNFRFARRAVRERNRWKFIYDFSTDERRLYDLSADPGERTDVFEKNGEQAARLEALLLSRMDPGSW